MLDFFGFQVSVKSETELQQERNEKAAAELKAKADETLDPLIEAASAAAEQKTVDDGHRTAATKEAVSDIILCPVEAARLTTLIGRDESY
jgi:hypothetical protein